MVIGHLPQLVGGEMLGSIAVYADRTVMTRHLCAVCVGGAFPRVKSMARVEGYSDGISSHVSVTKAGLQVGSH